jgi:uncharacterized protein (DUF849 family)
VSHNVIITCAVTGSADTACKSPAVPVTPKQIAESAIDAAKAGAAIVHIHVRDPVTTKASMDFALYKEVVDRIRASATDVVINLTTGPGARFVPAADNPRQAAPGTTLATPDERVRHVLALRPEICSLDMGSANFGDQVIINTPNQLYHMAEAISAVGVKPELEVFEPGHIMLARHMIEENKISGPALFQICLGISWASPAIPEAVPYMQRLLPLHAVWFAFGISKQQFPIAAQSVLLGGNVRVGLEDNLYIERGVLAKSNAALVEKAAQCIALLGREIASPAEAREILKLPMAA